MLDKLINDCWLVLQDLINVDTYEGEEDNVYVDIRLQYLGGEIYFYWGDPQYDIDHRGNWTYGSIKLYAPKEEVEKVITALYYKLIDELKAELEGV